MTKKFLALALALTLLLSFGSISAAEEQINWDDGKVISGGEISGTAVINVTGTVSVTAPITIAGSVIITGGGTLERGSAAGSMLTVNEGAVLTLEDVTLSGGDITVTETEDTSAAIYVTGGEVIMKEGAAITGQKKTVEMSKGGVRGAAVYMAGGKFTLDGGTIKDCEARSYGGAVYMMGGAEFDLKSGTVENNKTLDATADYGGGAFYVRDAVLKITGGTVKGNYSNVGGAIYNSSFGTTVITGGTIKDNSSPLGGAVFHSCKQGESALLEIGGYADIDTGNDIYLMNDAYVDKCIEITAAINHPIMLTVDNAAEGRCIATAADGVTLTNNDMAKLKISNPDYTFKLSDNKISLTQKTEEATMTLFLGFSANGGENEPEGLNEDVTVGQSATFDIPEAEPTREDYTFIGWSYDKDATEGTYKKGDKITITESTLLYAVWMKNDVPQAENAFTKPLKIADWTYGSEPEKPEAEAEYGEVFFEYAKESDGEYGKEVPKDAGTYYVKAFVNETPAYKGLISDPLEFNIHKKTVNNVIKIKTPVKNAVAETKIETDEYRADITWSPEVSERFAYSTKYSATIKITPGANYTVSGIPENGYEAAGAESVTNAADSDTLEVTYPETGKRSSSSGGGGGSSTLLTVSFESNGGSKVAKETVFKNSAVKEPDEPVKEGFTFAGWYKDKELKNKYDFSEKVTGGMTLYAAWEKNGGSENNNSKNEIILTIGEKDADVFGKTKTNDVAPKIVNDRTMLPARFVAENLGAEVSWNEEERLVTITGKNADGEEVVIKITVGSDKATVNGKEVKLDSPAFIENGRTYTPLRFISEELGAKVTWDGDEGKVIITKIEK